jgi:hypothetical protein
MKSPYTLQDDCPKCPGYRYFLDGQGFSHKYRILAYMITSNYTIDHIISELYHGKENPINSINGLINHIKVKHPILYENIKTFKPSCKKHSQPVTSKKKIAYNVISSTEYIEDNLDKYIQSLDSYKRFLLFNKVAGRN